MEGAQQHVPALVLLSLASRVLIVVLVALSSFLPLFDSSPTLALSANWSSPLLRWDAFHFLHLAQTRNRYIYEYEWAFFPGTSAVMHYIASLIIKPETHHFLWAGALAAATCDSTLTLYDLTIHHFHSPYFAFLTSLLSLLPSSPATLRFACYSEPFFTLWSYKGMLACVQKQWFRSAVFFMFASAFRSNGILLAGFTAYGLIVQPYFEGNHRPSVRTLIYAVLLTFIIVSPFLSHHFIAYVTFCLPTTHVTPEWCRKFIPSVYAHVQSTYWNVGPFKYWNLSQLPNFIISAPVLSLLIGYSCTHVYVTLCSYMRRLPKPYHVQMALFPPSLIPHAIHALVLVSTLLFASHTQIVLRLAPSMPLTYWAAAAAIVRDSDGSAQGGTSPDTTKIRWGYVWVWWSAVWGALSVVLWTVFLPPA